MLITLLISYVHYKTYTEFNFLKDEIKMKQEIG